MGGGYERISRNKVLCIYENVTILESKDHENKKEYKEHKSVFYGVIIMKWNFIGVRSDAKGVGSTIKMEIKYMQHDQSSNQERKKIMKSIKTG